MSDADCTPGREPRSVAASFHADLYDIVYMTWRGSHAVRDNAIRYRTTTGVQVIIDEQLVPAVLPVHTAATTSRLRPKHRQIRRARAWWWWWWIDDDDDDDDVTSRDRHKPSVRQHNDESANIAGYTMHQKPHIFSTHHIDATVQDKMLTKMLREFLRLLKLTFMSTVRLR